MINNKKGQLAVETLLIYGIAILIVMLAIGALVAFGVLDMGALLPDQCQLGNGLDCENYIISPTGVQFELRNSLGKNIQNFTISVRGEGDNLGLWGCTPTSYDSLIVNGEMTNPPVAVSCNVQVPSGKKISGIIEIMLQPVGSQLSKPISGKIRATVS